jgi:hypothetical protein
MIVSVIFVALYAVVVATLTVFVILLAYKWGIVEYLQTHGNEFVSKMAQCNFCMAWWVSLFLSLFLLGLIGDVFMLLVPFIATPLARRLI